MARRIDPGREPRYAGHPMAHPTQDTLAAALSLPEGERLRIASELLASVEEPYDDSWSAAWLEELERREQAVRDGGERGGRVGRGSGAGPRETGRSLTRPIIVRVDAQAELEEAADW
ncbi:addiction module protein [Sorangium sp. So ce204]|uniref:addiction module protein n=1 Tax=Sorangium sp. So ce204 TaxID=3133288 RepID=UPI003F608158